MLLRTCTQCLYHTYIHAHTHNAYQPHTRMRHVSNSGTTQPQDRTKSGAILIPVPGSQFIDSGLPVYHFRDPGLPVPGSRFTGSGLPNYSTRGPGTMFGTNPTVPVHAMPNIVVGRSRRLRSPAQNSNCPAHAALISGV